MTDRLKGFVVTLDTDIREDDAEVIRQAIQMIKCVLDVSPVVAGIDDHMNRVRIKQDLRKKIYEALD